MDDDAVTPQIKPNGEIPPPPPGVVSYTCVQLWVHTQSSESQFSPTHTALLSTLAAGHVRGVFVGHDHGNDWCCPHGTMIVCFGRHTGYGGYGRYMG